MKGITFKPTLKQNQVSSRQKSPITSHNNSTIDYKKASKSKIYSEAQDRLISFGYLKNQKKELAQKMNEVNIQMKYDFKPKINQRSKSIVEFKLNQKQRELRGDEDKEISRNHSPINLQQRVMDENEMYASDGDIAASHSNNSWNLSAVNKHQALYEDAKHRNLRHEHIYSKCIDRECTFKPKLVTKNSKLSQKTVLEVQNEVMDNLNNQYDQRDHDRSANARRAYLNNQNDSFCNNADSRVFERLANQAKIQQQIKA